MRKLILASGSPRRSELLKSLGIEFDVMIPRIIEKTDLKKPWEYVLELSRLKGESVFSQHPEALILSADTVVSFKSRILEKPKDREEARSMLSILSGQTHEVYTAVYLKSRDDEISFYEKTEVSFRKLSEKLIEGYLDTGEPFDKAGAYGIQGRGQVLVESIRGNYANVVGLPTAQLHEVFTSKKVGLALF